MVLLRLFSVITLLLTFANTKVLEYNEFINEPKSLAKDYYIHRLITEGKYTKDQILKLKKEVYINGSKLKKSFAKIFPKEEYKDRCKGIGKANILDANITCQNIRTTLYFSKNLDKKTRAQLATNLKKYYPQKSQMLIDLNSKNPLSKFIQHNNTSSFLGFYSITKPEEIDKYFSKNLNYDFVNKLYKTYGFKPFLKELILSKKHNRLRENLTKIDPKITKEDLAFKLGINAIMLNKTKIAKKYFEVATKTFKYQRQIDNSLFWIFLIDKDKSILKKLANSSDINIYSLYAKEMIKEKPFKIFIPKPTLVSNKEPNIKNPLNWHKILVKSKDLNKSQLKKLANTFYTKNSIGAYVYFMQKAENYKNSYFIIPHSSELKDTNATRKSLIFSIARQESLFIPSAISTSYALGTMQFMPFLANAIGKKEIKIKNFDQDEMFEPEIAYKFANHHLNYLEKFLYHPLFIAYAYNGGIGFTKRLLLKKDMFKKGKFEPFLSMELIPYDETKLYGKKVLANYIVYSQITGSNIKISQLLQNLVSPSLTDKFRK